jgi:hypothetical protein
VGQLVHERRQAVRRADVPGPRVPEVGFRPDVPRQGHADEFEHPDVIRYPLPGPPRDAPLRRHARETRPDVAPPEGEDQPRHPPHRAGRRPVRQRAPLEDAAHVDPGADPGRLVRPEHVSQRVCRLGPPLAGADQDDGVPDAAEPPHVGRDDLGILLDRAVLARAHEDVRDPQLVEQCPLAGEIGPRLRVALVVPARHEVHGRRGVSRGEIERGGRGQGPQGLARRHPAGPERRQRPIQGLVQRAIPAPARRVLLEVVREGALDEPRGGVRAPRAAGLALAGAAHALKASESDLWAKLRRPRRRDWNAMSGPHVGVSPGAARVCRVIP